jgi:hypothetical protein
MFVIGLVLSIKTLLLTWHVNSRFFSLKIGPLFLLFIFNSFEWLSLVLSLQLKGALPILNYVTFATAADNFFMMILSKRFLGRKTNFGHFLGAMLGLVGFFCCEFVVYEGKNTLTSKTSFNLDETLSSDQKLAYVYYVISRLCHASACIVHKRALLKEAAFDRFKNFKLSVSMDAKNVTSLSIAIQIDQDIRAQS